MGRFTHLIATAVVASLQLSAFGAKADCLQIARAVAKQKGEKACFVAKEKSETDIGADACKDKSAVRYYEEKSAIAGDAGPPLGAGGAQCAAGVWRIAPAPGGATAGAGASDPAAGPRAHTGGAAGGNADHAGGGNAGGDAAQGNADLQIGALLSLETRTPTGNREIEARGTGAAEIAAEAAQILGQIVVDRATQAAYQRISDAIRTGLQCDDASPKFPATCTTLSTIRIQDLAMSRQALVRALASDLANLALADALKTAKDGAPKDVTRLGMRLLGEVITTLGDPTRLQQGHAARIIADEVQAFARSHASAPPDEAKPLLLASAALVKCYQTTKPVSNCSISEYVDAIADANGYTDEPIRRVGRSVARGLLAGISATSGEVPAPDPRARIGAIVDGLFDGMCYAADKTKDRGCPPILDASSLSEADYILPLSIARGMIQAAIDEDTNRMLASATAGMAKLVQDAADKAEENQKGRRKALRLLGGVVQYADTFVKKDTDDSEEQKHDQRTKILESLTADMTQRTGREGDTILSLGGSLSLLGGMRFHGDQDIAMAPFSLSLGLGVQHVPTGGAPGLHLEFGFLDLGQYMSLEKEKTSDGGQHVVVAKPDLEDAFDVSLRAGIQWGRDVPLFLAGMVGYSPFYEFKTDTEIKRGSFNAGIVAGAYVPLLDAN